MITSELILRTFRVLCSRQRSLLQVIIVMTGIVLGGLHYEHFTATDSNNSHCRHAIMKWAAATRWAVNDTWLFALRSMNSHKKHKYISWKSKKKKKPRKQFFLESLNAHSTKCSSDCTKRCGVAEWSLAGQVTKHESFLLHAPKYEIHLTGARKMPRYSGILSVWSRFIWICKFSS